MAQINDTEVFDEVIVYLLRTLIEIKGLIWPFMLVT